MHDSSHKSPDRFSVGRSTCSYLPASSRQGGIVMTFHRVE